MQSKTEQIQILMSEHINGHKRLFGDKFMEWIDVAAAVAAAVAARRHCGYDVFTTAAVDRGSYVNNTIVLKGQLTYVKRTSMVIRVDTFVEKQNGRKLKNDFLSAGKD